MGRILGYWGRDGSDRCRFSQIAPVSSFPDLVEINNKNDTSKGNKPIKRVFPMFSQEIRRKQDFIGGDAEVIYVEGLYQKGRRDRRGHASVAHAHCTALAWRIDVAAGARTQDDERITLSLLPCDRFASED